MNTGMSLHGKSRSGWIFKVDRWMNRHVLLCDRGCGAECIHIQSLEMRCSSLCPALFITVQRM